MTFEFLIVCDIEETRDFLVSVLTDILESNQNDFDDSMLQVQYSRPVGNAQTDGGDSLLGFSLELPESTAEIEVVVDEFASSLRQEDSPVYHVVRFEDPLLREELSERSAEIFALEMKLRRVLSFIYLNAYQEPYNLLQEERMRTVTQNIGVNQMEGVMENQFFHILFSHYRNLNQRDELRFDKVLDMIRDSEEYEVLRAEILRFPIDDTEDASLISALDTLVEPIEQMRNCVAHNRRPSQRIRRNYFGALQSLNERLDNYLAVWAI